MPSVNPPTTSDVADEGNVVGAWATPPTYGVTMYAVIGLPPSLGADHDTATAPSPGVAVTSVGVDGTVADDLVMVPGLPPGPRVQGASAAPVHYPVLRATGQHFASTTPGDNPGPRGVR